MSEMTLQQELDNEVVISDFVMSKTEKDTSEDREIAASGKQRPVAASRTELISGADFLLGLVTRLIRTVTSIFGSNSLQNWNAVKLSTKTSTSVLEEATLV